MFCANCGKELLENVRFCWNCGAPSASAGIEIKQEKAVNFIQAQPVVVPTAVTPTAAVYANQSTIAADEKYCFSCCSVIKKAADMCPKCGVYQNKRSGTTAVDVYCTSCGKVIKKEASVCPFCGVRQDDGTSGEKNKTTALLLCIFLGIFGAHRFYVGKIGSAIGMLALLIVSVCGSLGADTEGSIEATMVAGFLLLGFLVWWIIDIVMIGNGSFKDSMGNPLKKT